MDKAAMPEGKYLASVKLGPKGQIVVPKEVREMFGVRPGDTLLLLAAGSEVLWVCGSGFAEGLAPDETTTQILQMEQET